MIWLSISLTLAEIIKLKWGLACAEPHFNYYLREMSQTLFFQLSNFLKSGVMLIRTNKAMLTAIDITIDVIFNFFKITSLLVVASFHVVRGNLTLLDGALYAPLVVGSW